MIASSGNFNAAPFSDADAKSAAAALQAKRPLVHCLTNEVVQEITADVLLAAGASPAMVVALEEAPTFAGIADAVLVNVGTPYPDRLKAMHAAARRAAEACRPWVLDPVAAGGIPWRDEQIRSLLAEGPAIVRGNASEIMALAGIGSGGKGVDSINSSNEALAAAQRLAREAHTIVCVTGKTDYVTDGERFLSIDGGDPMTCLVVGTGCSLSALAAAAAAAAGCAMTGAAAACWLAKRAAEYAARRAVGPGSFHSAYLDGLYLASRGQWPAA